MVWLRLGLAKPSRLPHKGASRPVFIYTQSFHFTLTTMASRNFCFTLFFHGSADFTAEEEAIYEAQNLATYFSDPLFKYIIISVEQCPDTGRIHWQGYMELFDPVRFTAVKVKAPMLQTAHFEKRRGTREQAKEYCDKEESRIAGPFEFGNWEIHQGTRSDLEEVSAAITAGAKESDIARDFPVQYIKFARGIKALLAMQHTNPAPDPDFVPRPWQQRVLDLLSQPANDRSIIWVTDTTGNKGKTRLATNLVAQHAATTLSGKLPDMTYGFFQQCQKGKAPAICCFDITRAAGEYSGHLYSMAESLKSGRLFNTKYESQHFTFPTPHVIFFANRSWDREKFSHDRVIELDLNNPEWA